MPHPLHLTLHQSSQMLLYSQLPTSDHPSSSGRLYEILQFVSPSYFHTHIACRYRTCTHHISFEMFNYYVVVSLRLNNSALMIPVVSFNLVIHEIKSPATVSVIAYRILIFPRQRQLSGSTTTASCWLCLAGQLGETGVVNIPKHTLDLTVDVSSHGHSKLEQTGESEYSSPRSIRRRKVMICHRLLKLSVNEIRPDK